MGTALRVLAGVLIVATGGIEVYAAQHPILGRKVVLRNPGDEASRRGIFAGRDAGAEESGIVGDPSVNGATLRLIANGATSTDQVFVLPAAGWRTMSNGFKFVHSGLGVPVQSLRLRVASSGRASFRVDVRGNIGGLDLDGVPPNPGTDAVAVLEIHGGDTYCTSLGGAAGGTVLQNSGEIFKMRSAAVEVACPVLSSPLCCTIGLTCAWAATATDCTTAGGMLGTVGSVCSSASGTCEPAPADPGECCELTTSFGSPCGAGPGLAGLCTLAGGTFVANAVCTPTGECASPSGAFLDGEPAP
jgi:hypothetical protein